jgi:hypothetical protein
MKKLFLGMVWLLFASTLQQCTDDGESAGTSLEKVQFTFSYKYSDVKGGRVQEDVVPDALLLTLERAPGDPLFTSRRIPLLRVGDSFMTEPIEITPGSYTITDFMLVAEEAVIYLTPLQNSPLSKAVNHPLPYPLTVNKDQASTIDMEVIAVGMNPPEDFGYASFIINNMNPFRISVFAGTTLTNATAYVLEGWDTIRTQSLDAGINFLSFPGDSHGLHKLIITKPGYSTAIKPFHYDELIDSLHGLPLKIMLEPAIFTIHPAETTYSMRLMGDPGTLNIDWGDGTRESFILRQDTLATHTYYSPACCAINITGDLDKIRYVHADHSNINNINVQGLSTLGEIRLGYMQGPSVIDFTHNVTLFAIFMPAVSRLKQVILPPASIFQAYFIDVSGPNQISTADVDNLIDQVYVQASRPVAGSLILNNALFPDEFVGPPSPSGMDKLRALRDVYYWYILPNP